MKGVFEDTGVWFIAEIPNGAQSLVCFPFILFWSEGGADWNRRRGLGLVWELVRTEIGIVIRIMGGCFIVRVIVMIVILFTIAFKNGIEDSIFIHFSFIVLNMKWNCSLSGLFYAPPRCK